MSEYEEPLAIDMSELGLMNEATEIDEIDPEAEYGAAPEVPPEFDADGKEIRYMVTPKPLLDEYGKWIRVRTDRQGQRQFSLAVEWHFDEVRAYPVRDWPSTMVFGGISAIDAILKAYTGAPGIGLDRKQKALKAAELIEAGRQLRITGRWEAVEIPTDEERQQPDFEYPKPFLVGMRKFPCRRLEDGSVIYEELRENPKTGKRARTQFAVRGYWPL